MEYLFNYTLKLKAEIFSLVEDISALQGISEEKKKSISAEKKVKDLIKQTQKKLYFLRILEHISYLSEYKGDIARAIATINTALNSLKITKNDLYKIQSHLSSICAIYPDEEETKAIAPLSLSAKVIDKLEATMKALEEILLSQYGLTSPITNLDEKIIATIEDLFNLPLDELTTEEKKLIEKLFNHIHNAFEKKATINWEDAFIQCTSIMNELKTKAGLPPNSTLEITIDEIDPDNEDS